LGEGLPLIDSTPDPIRLVSWMRATSAIASKLAADSKIVGCVCCCSGQANGAPASKEAAEGAEGKEIAHLEESAVRQFMPLFAVPTIER
jgi:hypothetical protein